MRILVHICCGPCAITVLQRLSGAGHTLAGFFLNPNIHPLAEYLRRREGAVQVAERLGIPLILPDAEPENDAPWHAPDLLREAGIEAQVSGAFPPHPRLPDTANPVPWLRLMAGREEGRCELCWRIRLWRTARRAARDGFDAFTSSLLYSRHQNHALITALGEQAAAMYGITFAYEDFRTSWQQGIALSKEWGIYRQQYCGCVYSEYERYAKMLPGDAV